MTDPTPDADDREIQAGDYCTTEESKTRVLVERIDFTGEVPVVYGKPYTSRPLMSAAYISPEVPVVFTSEDT